METTKFYYKDIVTSLVKQQKSNEFALRKIYIN